MNMPYIVNIHEVRRRVGNAAIRGRDASAR
jgi:hypothetical protein